MKRLAIALLLALTLAGPACAQPTSGVVNPTLYGVTAGKDASPGLQRLIDRATGKLTLALPPGRYPLSDPLYVDADGVTIAGAGPGVELCPADGRNQPAVVLGVKRSAGGVGVRPAHRPDGFGLLDQSIAPTPGAWRGFASDSDAYLCCVGNAAQLGAYQNGEWGWNDPRGYTVEAAVYLPDGVQPLAGSTVLGLGGADRVGPWWIGIDGNLAWCCRFKTAEQPTDPNTDTRDFRNTFDFRGVGRIRLTFDHLNGLATLVINGQTVAQASYPRGSTFARPRGHLPFWIGPAPNGEVIDRTPGSVPRLTVLGLRVSAGVRPDAGNDAARYRPPASGPHDGSTIVALDGSAPGLARHVPLYCWPGADGWTRGVAFVGQRNTLVWTRDLTLRDLSVTHGAVAVGSVLDARLERVEATGGAVGLLSIPSGASYHLDAEGCRFGGSDAAVSLAWVLCRWTRVDLTQGGSAHARFAGCGGFWAGGMAGGEGLSPVAGIDLVGADYGGVWRLSDLNLDNESRAYSVAAVRVDRHLMTRLSVTNLVAGLVGPGACAVLLRGTTPSGNDVPTASISGVGVWGGDASVRAEAGWRVSVDGLTQPAGSSVPAARPEQ